MGRTAGRGDCREEWGGCDSSASWDESHLTCAAAGGGRGDGRELWGSPSAGAAAADGGDGGRRLAAQIASAAAAANVLTLVGGSGGAPTLSSVSRGGVESGGPDGDSPYSEP